ncbi:MAG: hypothetical protein KIS78_06580 [Labilithrix sp.]|nr:hypothetical protein [Labilithrix sp.]MCW5832103.1 hypothetical protein [Labilithrix sp.]
MKPSVTLFVVGMSLASLGGCVYEDEPPRRLAPEPQPYSPDPAPGTSSGDPGTSPASPAPMLVEVDADQTMNAVGGEGVGVFIEYARGGHWHVWWTCDTTETGQSCDFSVSATAASGNVTNLDLTELAGGYATSPNPSRVEASSTTTTEVHGVRFDTNPGAVITVDAAVGGLKDGAFLFFVQDGKVNGGFTGKLTNPLQLQGNAP